jgi:Cdc6-like AAA superfamily ATPase
MSKNPKKTETTTKLSFAPLLPIKLDMDLFVDRKEEETIVSKAIANNQHVLVLGRRGAGKTVLLNRILYTHSAYKNMLLVQATPLILKSKPTDIIQLLMFQLHKEMQTRPTERVKELLKSITRSINMSYIGWEMSSGSLESQGVADYELLDRFQNMLISLWEKHLKVIFLLDDLDKNVEGFLTFFGQLRDYLWRTRAIFVATGNLEKKGLYLQPPLDSFFDVVMELKPLSYNNLRKIILRRSSKDTFLEEHLRGIYQMSCGNPREAIRLAQITLNRHLSARELLKITEAETKIMEGMNSQEKAVVQYLAKQGSSCASDKDFQRVLGITRSRLTQILLKLKKKGVLTTFKEGRKQFYEVPNKYSK